MPSIVPDLSAYLHVVAAVIRHPEQPSKILITQRKKGQHLEDLWEFPGGKVEAGEAPFHALRRELLEETGILVRSAQPFHSVLHHYQDKAIFLDVWQVKSYLGEAHGREQQNAVWVDIADLSQYDFPAADDPVLAALNLPAELLITPETEAEHMAAFAQQFDRVMLKHPYKLVLFRAPQLTDKQYLQLAESMQQTAAVSGAEIIIHRSKLKSLKSDMFAAFRHRHINSELHLSASCHDLDELKQAERMQCQFALLSNVRLTDSHPGRSAKGWHGFRHLSMQCRLPVYALGGIQREDYAAACYQGGVGVAGIGDFWSA